MRPNVPARWSDMVAQACAEQRARAFLGKFEAVPVPRGPDAMVTVDIRPLPDDVLYLDRDSIGLVTYEIRARLNDRLAPRGRA